MRKIYLLLITALSVLTSNSHAQDSVNFIPHVFQSQLRAEFDNISILNGPGNRKALWTFGDGTSKWTEPLADVEHLYPAAGTYLVCLKMYKYNSNTDSVLTGSSCKTISFQPSCNAEFQYRDSVVQNPYRHIVRFNSFPHHNQNLGVTQVCWRFGDGTDTCINNTAGMPLDNLFNITHTYYQDSLYNVCVKITYSDGCVGEKCRIVNLGGTTTQDSCQANFNVLASNHPLGKTFVALPWHSNQKRPERICWTFGDGRDTCINYNPAQVSNYTVFHQYQQAGNYNVCVKIKYQGGCEADKCKIVAVQQPAPDTVCKVRLSEAIASASGLTRNFKALTSSPGNKKVKTICWIFGDGSDTCINITDSLNIQEFFITHTYPAPGTYQACVVAKFDGGCEAVDCKAVVIRSGTRCGGYFTDSLVTGRTYKFSGRSIHHPDDQVISYKWTFGDGTTGDGPNVTHTYQQPGTYEVCLIIKTQKGCESRICGKIIIPGNNNRLLLSPNPVLNNLHVKFHSSHNETVTLKVMNSSGVVVRTWTKPATAGWNEWDFDVANLLTGMYTFIVQSPNQQASAIFFKL